MKIMLYALCVFLSFACFGFYLNQAHGEETAPSLPPVPSQSNADRGYGFTPQGYVVPRISSTDAPLRHRNAKTCGQYLSLCERSCSERGSLFKFECIGQDFQPFQDHFRCQCGDEAFRQVAKKEDNPAIIQQEQAK